MERTVIAAIDAGSNAIRLNISVVDASGLHLLESERVPVRLGHHAFTQGELDRETIGEALNTFTRFRNLFDHHRVEHYRAVATSALRNARNRELLQDRIWLEAHIRLDVIDGNEEARLVGKAVAHAFRDKEAPQTVLDLGGGSLEISVRDGEEWRIASLRVGTVRLLESFSLTGAMDDTSVRMVRRYVKTVLRSSRALAGVKAAPPVAVCGGNAEALARLFGVLQGGTQVLSRAALKEALPDLLSLDVPGRMQRFGVSQDRAEVMGIAALVFHTAAKELKLERLLAPGVGIREGVLLDLAGDLVKSRRPGVGARRKALMGSARAFAERLGHDLTHGEQVCRLARSIFDQLREVHGLDDRDRTILELASLLHDVGEVVHRRGHHKHGEYLIRSGRIPGLRGSQREMVAALARSHRKSPPTEERHPGFAALSPKNREVVLKLAAILRLADSLDADHRQRIVSIRTQIENGTLILGLALRAGEPAQPPALTKANLLEEVFGLRVALSTREGTKGL